MTDRVQSRIESCRSIVAICVEFTRGAGVEDDPVRLVTAYYLPESGLKLVERDPWAEEQAALARMSDPRVESHTLTLREDVTIAGMKASKSCLADRIEQEVDAHDTLELLFTVSDAPGESRSTFVEAEVDGRAVNCGRWVNRDGYWRLCITKESLDAALRAHSPVVGTARIKCGEEVLAESKIHLSGEDLTFDTVPAGSSPVRVVGVHRPGEYTPAERAEIEIRRERARQDAQWGGPEHDDEHDLDQWLSFIGKQIKKLRAKRVRNRPAASIEAGLVKIAALGKAALESMYRLQEEIAPVSAERRARDMLERAGVANAQAMSAGDLVEIANLIANQGKKP